MTESLSTILGRVLKFAACLAGIVFIRDFVFARLVPPVLAFAAWIGVEMARSKGRNPVAGVWAPIGSEREEALRLFWPLWRCGFALNAFSLLADAFKDPSENWIVRATVTPWIIFTSLGILNGAVHLAAGDIVTLRRWLKSARHVSFLIVGFVPFCLLCVLGLFVLPFLWVFACGDRLKYQLFSRRLGRVTFRTILTYLRFIGFIRVKFIDSHPAGSRLLVGNHISMFDIISTLAHFENCGTFVKMKYTQIPFIAPMIRACGFIGIRSNDPESGRKAMILAKEALLRGESFAVWPEGTRTRDGNLGEFHNGIFRLAIETGINVTPVLYMSSSPVFNNRGPLQATDVCLTYTLEVGPDIVVTKMDRATPGRVLQLKEDVRSYFLRRLNAFDIPGWMRTSETCDLRPLSSSIDIEVTV